MNNGKERVKLSKVIQKMNLVNLTPQIDVSGIWLNLPILRVFLSRRDMKDICSFCQVIFHVLYSAGV